MKIGKLKWFNDKKGFGFITNDEGKNTAKGLQAKNVVVIDHMEQEGEEKEAMTQQ